MRVAGNGSKLDWASYRGKQEEQTILLIKKIIKMWKAQKDRQLDKNHCLFYKTHLPLAL